MAEERALARKPAAVHRRPAVNARVTPVAAVARPMSTPRVLQQRVGNQGTQALAAHVVARSLVPGLAPTSSASLGQLSISQPGDASEREAGHVADAVMRMPEATSPNSVSATPARDARTPLIQRRCAQCGDEDKGSKVQRRENSTESPEISPTVAEGIRALRGGGSHLPAATRAFFEPRFGADFSRVRVHSDARAAETARSISAKAFTVGADIAFACGQYSPESREGQRLLAHELTHVVQQGASGRAEVRRRSEEESTRSSITKDYVARLSDKELDQQILGVVSHAKAVDNRSAEYSALLENITLLLQERASRIAKMKPAGGALMQMMVEWHTAGLLDPPYRPADVPEIPPLPITQAQVAKLGPTPLAVGALAAPKLLPEPGPLPPARPPLRLVPPVEPVPPVAPVPVRVPVAVPIIAALTVLLWPSETAPPWMDEMNPVTGEPYGSPEEYDWVRRLTPQQQDYLRRLVRMRRTSPNPADDGAPDPTAVPVPVPKPKPKEKEKVEPCVSMDVPRKGGYVRHDAYATKVTGSTFDYYVRMPVGAAINYDGLRAPILVWEVKVGHGWFFNPDYAALRDLTLAKWDVQKNLGLFVAAACGYQHLWSIPDKWVASLLNTRWGGVPAVLSIPE